MRYCLEAYSLHLHLFIFKICTIQFVLWTGKANEQAFYFTVVLQKLETIGDIIINMMIFNIQIVGIHDNT